MVRLPFILLFAAAALAGWLSWTSWTGGIVAGCQTGGDCAQVMASAYSVWFGLPLAAFGCVLYLTALLASVLRWSVLAVFSAWGILAGALWCVTVQALILKAWCPWCCATHGIASVAACLLLVRFVPALPSHNSNPLSAGFGATASLMAMLVGAGILAGLQQFSAAVGIPSQHASAMVLPEHGMDVLSITEERSLSLFNERVIIDPQSVPVLGRSFFLSPAQAMQNPLDALMAPQPLVLLFDWTCPHCRDLVARLSHLKQPAQPQTAENTSSALFRAVDGTTIVLLPAWRDEEGRRLHELLLTSWLAGGPETEILQRSLFDGTLHVTSREVSARAASLRGTEPWQAAQRKVAAHVADILAMGAQVLRESDAMLENATLPRMISAAGILQGLPADTDLAAFITGGGAAFATRIEDVRQAATTNGSRIQFESTAVTTAPVQSGTSAIAEFRFTNTGTEPLRLVAVQTTCACTVPQGWKQTVQPGGKGDFIVRIDTTGHTSPMSRQINLLVNAANAPTGGMIPLRITANILPRRNTATAAALETADTPPEK